MPRKKQNNKEFVVYPVKPADHHTDLKKTWNENLPDVSTGALLTIVAKIKSGKSSLISNLFFREEAYRDVFKSSFFISDTIDGDDTMRYVKDHYEDTCYSTYDDSLIKKIWKYQMDQPRPRPSYSLVLDDCIGSIKMGSTVNSFCAKFRHITDTASLVIISSQKMTSISPIIRNNTTNWLLSNCKNQKKERERIAEELSGSFGGEETFYKLWDYACAEPYNWFYLVMTSNPPKAFKNFNEQIYPSEQFKDDGDDSNEDYVDDEEEVSVSE